MNSFSISRLECNCCKTLMYVPRKNAHTREKGHTKHLYCPKCREITAHTEIRNRDNMTTLADVMPADLTELNGLGGIFSQGIHEK